MNNARTIPASFPTFTTFELPTQIRNTISQGIKNKGLPYWVIAVIGVGGIIFLFLFVTIFRAWTKDVSNITGLNTIFEQKPDHYGVYLKENNNLLEILQQEGSPGRNSNAVSIYTNQTQPVLLVWSPDLVLQNLYLVSGGGEGQEVVYSSTPKDDGVLELKPRQPLQPDTYCLIQADPFGVSYFFPNWCFIVKQ